MAEKFKELEENHIEFILNQHLFFVGTAPSEGRVNVSPKGMETLKIISPRKIIWLNLTGSGNETSSHVQENGRMTLMFCSFDKHPLILRIYGEAKVIHPYNGEWNNLVKLFDEHTGARQFFDLDIDLVQTSCGYGVPFYKYLGERETLTKWADTRGRDGIQQYWKEKNQVSLDGKPTNIVKNV